MGDVDLNADLWSYAFCGMRVCQGCIAVCLACINDRVLV